MTTGIAAGTAPITGSISGPGFTMASGLARVSAMRGIVLADAESRALPVAGQHDLPAHADVVVIGGGIIGIATAYYLAQKRMSVVVLEKGSVGAEQSSRSFGAVISRRSSPADMAFTLHSRALWHGLSARIGRDVSFRADGMTIFCSGDEEVAAHEEWIGQARVSGLDDARIITGDELQRRSHGASSAPKAALLIEGDGGVNPAAVTSVLAQAAMDSGARILTNCAARAVETSGGAISEVITERGSIRTKNVVLAGGSWTRLFAGNAGIDLPFLGVFLSEQRIGAVDGPPGVGSMGAVGWRREAGGTYASGAETMVAPVTLDSFQLFRAFLPMLRSMESGIKLGLGGEFIRSMRVPRRWKPDDRSPFESARTVAPAPNHRHLDESLAALRAAFPVFQKSQVIERWGGTLTVTPDNEPVISAVPGIDGMFVNSGFSLGITMGPGAGHLMADLVSGQEPAVDPGPFSLERFHPAKAPA